MKKTNPKKQSKKKAVKGNKSSPSLQQFNHALQSLIDAKPKHASV